MRNHPDTGAEIAVNALDGEQISWIRHHHEHWDGAGYPNGLTDDLIPAGARACTRGGLGLDDVE